MSDWQSPKVEKPPQGRKILWLTNGDVFVAQRFGDKYLVLSPLGGKIKGEPLLWKLIDLPDPYTGFLMIKLNESDEMITIDQLEIEDADFYNTLVETLADHRFEEEKK